MFSEEGVDTAWIVTEQELAPRLAGQELVGGGSCPALFRQVRGNRMAKAALENAVWDLEALKNRVSLADLLGGTRSVIPAGVDRHPAFAGGVDGRLRKSWRPDTSASS